MGLRVLEKTKYFASVGNRTPIRRSVHNEVRSGKTRTGGFERITVLRNPQEWCYHPECKQRKGICGALAITRDFIEGTFLWSLPIINFQCSTMFRRPAVLPSTGKGQNLIC